MLGNILEILSFLVKTITLSDLRAKRKIKKDADLAKAIQGSDGKKLAAIKKIRDAGKGPVIIVLCCLMLQGCNLFGPSIGDVPLTEGEIPFKLPPGEYTDVNGELHNVKDERWSISEEDLFKRIVEEDSDYNGWKVGGALALAAALGAGAFLLKNKQTD